MLQSLLGCCSKQQQNDNKASFPTWRQLLESSGTELWEIREFLNTGDEADDSNNDSVNDDHRHPNTYREYPKNSERNLATSVGHRICSGYQSPCPSTICILFKPSEFQVLEDNYRLDKHGAERGSVLPLTKCIGTEWDFQRKIMQNAFSNIMPLSLEAAQKVQWRLTPAAAGSNKVDLKQEVLSLSLQWLLLLFCGQKDGDDRTFEHAVFFHWTAIRSRNKEQKKIHKTFKTLVKAIALNSGSGGCLLNNIYAAFRDGETSMAKEQSEVNSVYAMMAAFDAVQSIIFWTIWNLSKDGNMWEICQSSILQDTNDAQKQVDIDGLIAFKKRSTRNESVDLTQLSLLARAVVETVRVYPPIWTLPRTFQDVEGTLNAVKLDVLAANDATDRQWDPTNATGNSPPVTSFGIGKRSCPAGSAALVAAFIMVRNFVTMHKVPMECKPGKAIDSSYLGPTLCTEGPQFFDIERLKIRNQN